MFIVPMWVPMWGSGCGVVILKHKFASLRRQISTTEPIATQSSTTPTEMPMVGPSGRPLAEVELDAGPVVGVKDKQSERVLKSDRNNQ